MTGTPNDDRDGDSDCEPENTGGDVSTVPDGRLDTWDGFSTTRYGETNRWPWLYRSPVDAGGDGEGAGMDPDDPVERRWYWDADHRKAYYPCHADAETVHFVTVWHREEVAGALADDGLRPIPEVGPDRNDNQFVDGPLDSFRLLEEDATAAYEGAVDDVDGPDSAGGETG